MQTEAGAYGWALNITAPALIYPCLDVREGEAPAEPKTATGRVPVHSAPQERRPPHGTRRGWPRLLGDAGGAAASGSWPAPERIPDLCRVCRAT